MRSASLLVTRGCDQPLPLPNAVDKSSITWHIYTVASKSDDGWCSPTRTFSSWHASVTFPRCASRPWRVHSFQITQLPSQDGPGPRRGKSKRSGDVIQYILPPLRPAGGDNRYFTFAKSSPPSPHPVTPNTTPHTHTLHHPHPSPLGNMSDLFLEKVLRLSPPFCRNCLHTFITSCRTNVCLCMCVHVSL